MQYSLKELRARHGWTQAEAAKELGVSPQTYNAWEKDLSNIKISKVMAIANVFGVPLEEIKLK